MRPVHVWSVSTSSIVALTVRAFLLGNGTTKARAKRANIATITIRLPNWIEKMPQLRNIPAGLAALTKASNEFMMAIRCV